MNTDAIIDLIMRVLKALKIIKDDTPTPTVPPTVPPAPPTVPPPASRAVTKDDDFRTLPTITKARMCEILRGYPMEQECGAIWEVMEGNPLPVSMSWMESRYGQDSNAQLTFNPLGLLYNETTQGKPYLEVGANGVAVKLLKFTSWREAFVEWDRRMSDPCYKAADVNHCRQECRS